LDLVTIPSAGAVQSVGTGPGNDRILHRQSSLPDNPAKKFGPVQGAGFNLSISQAETSWN
jgi:hypothetical protein